VCAPAGPAAVGGGWAGGPGPAPSSRPLDKRIPVAAGLVSGSWTRATIDGAAEVWAPSWMSMHAWSPLHLGLMCRFLAGGPALVEGRGEQVG
jgi:4-diphosphocytidyl-2C-methyl-D-erythritol kinase